MFMLSGVILNVVLLNVDMLSVFMLIVIILNVVAPFRPRCQRTEILSKLQNRPKDHSSNQLEASSLLGTLLGTIFFLKKFDTMSTILGEPNPGNYS
jgi:hypothetical protein